MSPPDSPTLVNRNANRAEGVQTRKSAAIATTDPGAGGDALDRRR